MKENMSGETRLPIEAPPSESGTEEYLFYPESPGDFERAPLALTIVGEREDSPEAQKAKLAAVVARHTAERMRAIVEQGKLVLWNMPTGKTFNWKEYLPSALAAAGVKPSDIIVIIKEDAWDKNGRHFPAGHPFDFRGKRVEGFHQVLGIAPEMARVTDGEITGNLVAPSDEMSPEEGARYMEETWRALQESGKVVGLTTTGVGEDTHIAEMQVNKQSVKDQLNQREFFTTSLDEYSEERGLYRWIGPDGEFVPVSNVFSRRQGDEWVSAGRGEQFGTDTAGATMLGMGWRALQKNQGGVIFVADSKAKSFAARAALTGSFAGELRRVQGETVAHFQAERGEGNRVWNDLIGLLEQLEAKQIVPNGYAQEKQALAREKDGAPVIERGVIDTILNDVYAAYLERGISPQETEAVQEFFLPVWQVVNRYLGVRSPLSTWVRLLNASTTPIELLMTRDAAKELPLPQK